MTCGLRLSGVTAPLAFRGATNTDIFETYVQDVLVPELKPGDVVIWDNLKPHQSEEAIEAIEAAGASVEPLPPWSPDLTPIEEMVSNFSSVSRITESGKTHVEGLRALSSDGKSSILGVSESIRKVSERSASASMTAQPSFSNSAATVLLPEAMPPIIPIRGFSVGLPTLTLSGSPTPKFQPTFYLLLTKLSRDCYRIIA